MLPKKEHILPSNLQTITSLISRTRRFYTNPVQTESPPPHDKRIYLDFQATTPIDPRVLDAMLPYQTSNFGNPHSRTHSYGWSAETATEKARSQLAALIKAPQDSIIFTSGATESNNIALKGLARFKMQEGITPHFITLQTEHKSILDTLRVLEEEGCEVTYLKPKRDGLVNLEELCNSIKPNTICVSIMGVNNEIGVVQDMNAIGAICKERGVVFHTDAAQAVGKIDIDVEKMNIGMLSVSGHKIYGPKGIGCLYMRKRPRIRIKPIVTGGGQERGLRSGTVPTHLVVGMGKAAELCSKEMMRDYKHLQRLSDRLRNYLETNLSEIIKNGYDDKEERKDSSMQNDSKLEDKREEQNIQAELNIEHNNNEANNEIENEREEQNLQVKTKMNDNSNKKDKINNSNKENNFNNSNKENKIKNGYKEINDNKTEKLGVEIKNPKTGSTDVKDLCDLKWYPGCLNLSFSFVEGESLMMAIKDIALSSGSACTSASLEPSYTLRALGTDDDLAHSSIRFGMGRFTTEQEIDRVGEMTVKAVKKLRDMSPLYEMVNEGIDLKKIEWS